MPYKRRLSRIPNKESKSTGSPEYMEITNLSKTESDKQMLSQASPRANQHLSPPKPFGKTNFHFKDFSRVWKTYGKLKMSNAFESLLNQCLQDNNFRSEEELVQCYTSVPLETVHPREDLTNSEKKESMTRKGKERVGESSTPKSVPKKLAFTSLDSKSGSESKMDKKKKDDDATLFNNFEIRASITSGVKGNGQLFRNQMHRDYNELLLSKSIMTNRSVDFAYLDSIGILVKQHFKKLGIYEFCLQSTHVYVELIACFHSNLSFISLN